MTTRDALTFFLAWARNPLRVASVTPSSAALGDLITREITSTTGPIIELGPGTGVFTRALVGRGVRESDLTLVEFSLDFASLLEERYPQARIKSMDATRLRQASLFQGAPAGAVISGLPLLSMQPGKVFAILSGSFGYLRQDGAFYQFTYGPRCPIPVSVLDRLGLKATRIGTTLCNLPPAGVYRIVRNQRR